MNRSHSHTQLTGSVAAILLLAISAVSTLHAADTEAEPEFKGKPISQWIKQLLGKNRGKQVRAARALGEIKGELAAKVVPLLIPILESTRANNRFVAAQTLGKYGPVARAAVPKLLPLLFGTQYERNRAEAAKALGLILKDAKDSKEVAEVTTGLILKIDKDFDKYSDVRREAVTALGMIGPAAKACIPKLVKVLTQANNMGSTQDQEFRLVRRQTAWTMGRMGILAKEHVDRLISMMHAEGRVVIEYVEALGLIGPIHENVIPNIMDAIERAGRPGDSGAFKTKAFEALTRCGAGSKAAIPLAKRMLQKTTGDDKAQVKAAIQKFLKDIGPTEKTATPKNPTLTKKDGKAENKKAPANK